VVLCAYVPMLDEAWIGGDWREGWPGLPGGRCSCSAGDCIGQEVGTGLAWHDKAHLHCNVHKALCVASGAPTDLHRHIPSGTKTAQS
jgi:hypothetical protein